MGSTVYASSGYAASDVTIKYYNGSSLTTLITLGGGKAPSSGSSRGNGGSFTASSGENTY